MTDRSILYSNTQRPGAVASITLDEFAARETQRVEGKDVVAITVHRHKTAIKGAAVIMLETQLAADVILWHERLRPAFLPTECQLLFAERSGRPLDHLSRKLAQLGQRLGFKLPNASSFRKAVVTRAAERSATPAEREALAAHMCHNPRTAAKHYDKSSKKKKKTEGYTFSQSLLQEKGSQEGSSGSGATPLRKRYTPVEEDLIATHFASAVESRRPPVTAEAKEFLTMYPSSFIGRTPKDIVDKVRSLIRRNN